MARPEGFEPPTPRFVVCCSIGNQIHGIAATSSAVCHARAAVEHIRAAVDVDSRFPPQISQQGSILSGSNCLMHWGKSQWKVSFC
jgi:hypothetical protein